MVAIESSNPFPVEPTGFLIGSYLALILYGLHLTQLHSYLTRYSYDPLRRRLLVLWVFLLSTFQVAIIFAAGWRYFVGGTRDGGKIWGEFWDPLSVQDGLIPLMAMTAQFYFGHRAWLLWNKNRWIKWFFIVVPTITMICGLALAITARIWSNDPFVPGDQLHDRPISVPSQVVAILWMGMSAFTDGVLTLLLVTRFVRSKPPKTSSSSTTISRLIALTLETVLLTHIVGASMCIIFLASPAARRTQHPLFWVLLEIITELYALSILFTINARRPASDDLYEANSGGRGNLEGVALGMSTLDRQVEGYQGSTPFGVQMTVPSLGYQDSSGGVGGSERNGGASPKLATPYNQQDGKVWVNPELDDSVDPQKDYREQRSH